MKHIALAMIATALSVGVLGASGAFAEANRARADSHQAWMESEPTYQATPPLKMTCTEFLGVKEVYRPYVIAYLDGHAHGKATLGGLEEKFVPVSVPTIIEQCKAAPNTKVSDVVNLWNAGPNK